MSDIVSRPYNVNPQMACAGCVFGGSHEEWCRTFNGMKVVIDPDVRAKTGCDIVFLNEKNWSGIKTDGTIVGGEWNTQRRK